MMAVGIRVIVIAGLSIVADGFARIIMIGEASEIGILAILTCRFMVSVCRVEDAEVFRVNGAYLSFRRSTTTSVTRMEHTILSLSKHVVPNVLD